MMRPKVGGSGKIENKSESLKASQNKTKKKYFLVAENELTNFFGFFFSTGKEMGDVMVESIHHSIIL